MNRAVHASVHLATLSVAALVLRIDAAADQNPTWTATDISRMQAIAAAAAAGDLGEGDAGTIEVVTPDGIRSIAVGALTNAVFGPRVDIVDLEEIFKARSKSNGGETPVGSADLVLTALSLVQHVGSPSALPAVRLLEADSDPRIAEAARGMREGKPPEAPSGDAARQVARPVNPEPLVEPPGETRDVVIEVVKDGPLNSLGAAQLAVRKHIADGSKGTLTVVVADGLYRECKELTFGPEDSGNPWLSITWQAAPGATPILSGSSPIVGWTKAPDETSGLAAAAAGNVWIAVVPGDLLINTLYDGDNLLTRAASRPLKLPAKGTNSFTQLSIDERLPELTTPTEAELIWRRTYYMNYLPIRSIDSGKGVIEVGQPGTYVFRYTDPGEFWIENALEFLDEPGEWVFRPGEGRIYYWPEGGSEPAANQIHYPIAENIVAIRGDVDGHNAVQRLTFDGFTLKHGQRMCWQRGRVGVQHDWDVFDQGWSGFYLRGAQDCEIRNCTVTATSGNGVKLGIHAINNRIRNNHIHHLGGIGISLVGYGPGKRDETHHNTIAANLIHHVGTLWQASAGILICQASNNRITNNEIRDLKYSGIVLVGGRSGIFYERGRNVPYDGIGYTRWDEIPERVTEGQWWHQIGYVHTRDNLIDFNDVSQVMLEREDGNGIYLSGVGTGNIIERNYLHSMSEGTNSQAGAIRFDDSGWFSTARFNVIANVRTGFTLKCVNTIENNVIYGYSQRGIRIATTNQVNTPSYGSPVTRNIIVSVRPGLTAGLTLETSHLDRNPTILEEPTIANNLYFDLTDPAGAVAHLQSVQATDGGVGSFMVADPNFVDPAAGDFRLRPNSPARRLGIMSIDKYGLQEPVGPIR